MTNSTSNPNSDDYKPIVELINIIKESGDQKPKNAEGLEDKKLGFIRYDEPSRITRSKQF